MVNDIGDGGERQQRRWRTTAAKNQMEVQRKPKEDNVQVNETVGYEKPSPTMEDKNE